MSEPPEDPGTPRVVSLAGFPPRTQEKAELEEKVRSLGGEVHRGVWSGRITHILVNNFLAFPEKVMLGLVSGRWVVTRRLVDRSLLRGSWANSRVGNSVLLC